LFGQTHGCTNKVQKEVDALLGDREEPEHKDLENVPYMSAVIRESLRLYPPIPLVSRTLDEDMEIEGYTIRKGVNVSVRPFVIHRNPAVWSSPEEFKPERFTASPPENADEPFAFIPFSAGVRNCIGQKFALNEMKVVLIMLLRSYTVSLVPLTSSAPYPSPSELPSIGQLEVQLVLFPANGVHIYFTKRVK